LNPQTGDPGGVSDRPAVENEVARRQPYVASFVVLKTTGKTVSGNTASHLRLHVEDLPRPKRPQLDEVASMGQLCDAFLRATGWTLRYVVGDQPAGDVAWSNPVGNSEGDPRGYLTLQQGNTPDGSAIAQAAPGISAERVFEFSASLAKLLNELHHTRIALWQREAELATGVPVTPHADEQAHLATRLEAVLKAGAQAAGCQAAAAYLLDEATRKLKLRSSWGLPKSRFVDPPRPLRGAVADLEALVGHAVVLEDTALLSHWKIPEEFRSAVCVPISSPTTPLGTLWMFCDRCRQYTVDDTNLIEIVAGRFAADLEREVLLQQSLQIRNVARQLSHASEWQQKRLPRIKPLLSGWQLAGWTVQSDCLGGDFHDWFVLPDGLLAVAVGDAQGKMFEAGLTAATLHTSLKSHACYRHTVGQMAERINETLWTASVGDQFASLFYGTVHPQSGEIEYVAAGHVHAAIVGDSLRPLVATETAPLGTQPDSEYPADSVRLRRGEVLVVVSEGVRQTLAGSRSRVLLRLVQSHRDRTAEELADKARTFVQRQVKEPSTEDQTILIVKRTGTGE
jgi:serine phosphatase RsbU (regulator of sigma subunit)